MARKASSVRQSFSPPNKSRQRAGRRSTSPFYGDILAIAGSLLRNRQEAGAEKIRSLAGAARGFAADLPDIPNIRTYAAAAADQMETLSDYASDTSMEQMVEDATDLAKRHPVATAAFAVAAGFGFVRLMTHAGSGHGETKQKTRTSSTRSDAKKPTASRKRAAIKARANGRDSSHGSANAA
jgi:hypothetical protein